MGVKYTYKDGVFRRLFNDKEKILELYNALTGKNYPPDTDVKIVTLDNAVFGDMKDDLSFMIGDRFIILTEHQSTINPNMPVRELCYIAKQLEKLVFSKAIYSKRLVKLPTPEFYVFYNGAEDFPVCREQKLSDAFAVKCDKISLELKVKVINVNYDKGAEILSRCRSLNEYSKFMYMIRERLSEGIEVKSAIEESIRICMKEGILDEFLKKNGGDIVSFLFEELTREECEQIREEDGYYHGHLDGEADTQRAIARNMISMKLAPDVVAAATGLSIDELEKIQQDGQ